MNEDSTPSQVPGQREDPDQTAGGDATRRPASERSTRGETGAGAAAGGAFVAPARIRREREPGRDGDDGHDRPGRPAWPASSPSRSASRGFRPSSSSSSSSQLAAVPADDDTVSLVDLAENLSDHRWAFLLVALLCALGSIGYALLATPVYTVDALVQVEDRKGSGLGALASVAQALDVSSSPVEGEIEILRSRTNVSQAVETLQLYTDIRVANRFPLIGEWLSERLETSPNGLAIAPSLPLVNPGHWAWGGEALILTHFQVPNKKLGDPHRLTIEPDGQWVLRDDDDVVVLQGSGAALSSAPDGDAGQADGGHYALQIGRLTARAGTVFELKRWSPGARVDKIREDLKVTETKRQSGIMRIEYPGVDAGAAARLVNAIADAYVRQNTQRRSEEAERSLTFLEAQLPDLRRQLDNAESALNRYRNEHRTIDIPGEIEVLLTQSVALEKDRLELELRNKEVEARYEPAHPVARALKNQLASVDARRNGLMQRIESLPLVQQDYLRLARDVQVNSQLYVNLLNNAQQLRVARAGTIGNVSIVDPAVIPQRPSRPRRALVVAVGVLAGLAGGFLLAQMLAALQKRVRDPRELEDLSGIHISATVPISSEQEEVDRRQNGKGRVVVPWLLARTKPTSAAVEALRTLRLNLQLSLAETRGARTILMTSAVPGQGKTFIASNLAWLIASAGPRVLLIDADLRRSSVGKYFATGDSGGLSEILARSGDPTPFIRKGELDNLHVLPAGAAPDNPGELFTDERIAPVFEWAAQRYDIVIVDAPPVLSISDTIVLGGYADVTAFVVRHKRVSQGDVADAVQQYQLTGAQIEGFVFNGFVPSRVRYGYGGRYGYGYGYGGRYGYYQRKT